MDAIDLFIGSDGTLGIISELEIILTTVPAVAWGVSCFFADEQAALDFTVAARPKLPRAAAFEYFDAKALDILRVQRKNSTAFASLPELDAAWACCVYVELEADDEATALNDLALLGKLLRDHGGSDRATWVARTDTDRETQRFFRHAVPESVNMLIDERARPIPPSPSSAATCPFPMSACTRSWTCTARRLPRRGSIPLHGDISVTTTCM